MHKATLRRIATLNLFDDPEREDEATGELLKEQLYATRLYIVLLSATLTIVVLYTCLDQKLIQYTVPVSLVEDYERLEMLYRDSLSCPCEQVSIPYTNMVSLMPNFHQVCSSDWISDRWITSLYTANESFYTPLDFRSIAASVFLALKSLCLIIISSINNYLTVQKGWTFYSSHALTIESFDIQADALINDMNGRLQTFAISSSTVDFITFVLRQTGAHSTRNTDAFQMHIPGSGKVQVVNNIYPSHDNVTFDFDIDSDFTSCGPFSSTIYKAGIYNWTMDARPFPQMMIPQPPPIHLVTGMYVGCLVGDGMLASTLECMYSAECINNTATWISNLPSNAWPQPLNRSLNLEFLVDDTIRYVLDNKMVDRWVIIKNFSRYYLTCAPIECSYKVRQRNNFIDIIGTLVGLYGGLTLALRLLAPQLVQGFIYLQTRIFRNRERMDRTIEASAVRNGSEIHERVAWKVQILQTWIKIKGMIASHNIFTAELADRKLGIIATRIYLALLVTSVLILTMYSSITVNSREITVSKPSLRMFENLHSVYLDTLVCPCTNVKPIHQSFVNSSSIRFHQICQSSFIMPVWIDGFFTIRFANESVFYELAETDFRYNGFSFFKNLFLLCNLLVNEVRIFQSEFLRQEFLTVTALSRSQFGLRIGSLINTLKVQFTRDRLTVVAILNKVIAATSIGQGMMFQTLNISGVPSIRRHSPAPPTYNTCACSVAYNCPDPAWSGGQFICRYGNNCTRNTIIWTIPGLVKLCNTIDTVLFSDLRCFYNQSCLDIVLSMFNVDMPDRLPLPEYTQNVKALNASLSSKYRSEDTVEFIVEQSFVEEWNLYPDFGKYYEECAPSLCTYYIHQRMDILYIVTTIIGIFGGLTVIFRLFTPIAVRLAFWIWDSRLTGRINRPKTSRPKTTPPLFRLKQQLMNMNFFQEEMLRNRIPGIQITAKLASRFYIVSFVLIMITLSVFNTFTSITIAETKAAPNSADFHDLYMKYPKTLSCACENVILSTDDFLSVTPSYHQICTSALVNTSWIVSLYGYGSSANGYSQMDRPLLSKYFQSIGEMCETARSHIDIRSFRNYDFKLTAKSVLPRDSFEREMRTLLDNFFSLALDSFRQMLRSSIYVIHNLQLPAAFNKDWIVHYGNQSNGYILRNVPRVYTSNGSCNCLTSDACREPLHIGSAELELPGLVVGCTPLYGVQMSTLECFYSNACITTIINHLEYYTNMDGSHPVNFTAPTVPQNLNISPLDASKLVRHSETSTIGQIFDDVFVEQWMNVSSYENYFLACAPKTCRYEYTMRQTGLYLVTTMLGLYGGLTVGLRLMIWNGARLYRFMSSQMFTRQTAIEPFTASQSS